MKGQAKRSMRKFVSTQEKMMRKVAWKDFVIPTHGKKENVSGAIDKAILTFDKQLEVLSKK